MYSVEDEDTLDHVTGHWLPLIRSTLGQHHHTPIILVGNKVDLVDYSTMEVGSFCPKKGKEVLNLENYLLIILINLIVIATIFAIT